MASIDESTMNDVHYLTKEQADKNYGSKGVAGCGLGFGIAGTVLGLMSGTNLLSNVLGGNNSG